MTEIQIQAAKAMREAIIRQAKERDRDLLYLRKAGSKGTAI